MIELSRLIKNYVRKGPALLSNVRFVLHQGDVLGLFGRNGSGKSTILKIMFGTLRADEIQLEVNGVDYDPLRNFKSKTIAYLPQTAFLPGHLRVHDVIEDFLESNQAARLAHSSPHISDLAQKRLGDLSEGQRKYVEFIFVIHLPHPIILLDEPFAMVEPIYRNHIKQVINSKQEEKVIVITDHYYEDVLSVSTSMALLDDSKLTMIENQSDLEQSNYLRR